MFFFLLRSSSFFVWGINIIMRWLKYYVLYEIVFLNDIMFILSYFFLIFEVGYVVFERIFDGYFEILEDLGVEFVVFGLDWVNFYILRVVN